MGLRRLSEGDKEVIRRALEAIHDGPFLDATDFPIRIGVERERLTDLLANWPAVDDAGTDSDEALLINNALNEIAHGVSLSADEWTRWFGHLPRDRVRDVLQRWGAGDVAVEFRSPEHFTDPPEAFVARIPAGIAEKRDLLLYLARELRLPDYFGMNWDALDECINDLAWIKARQVLLIHADIPLEAAPQGAGIYLSILNDAVRQWASSEEHDFRVVFPPSARDKVEALIASCEVSWTRSTDSGHSSTHCQRPSVVGPNRSRRQRHPKTVRLDAPDRNFKLTPQERESIRAGFDVDALERLLAAVEAPVRPLILSRFQTTRPGEPNRAWVKMGDPALQPLLDEVWAPMWERYPEIMDHETKHYPGLELARQRRNARGQP